MGRKVLQIVESAYRCTIEEQDDPIVWVTHAMKGAGADLHVLLTGNAVNYAAKGQDASGLAIGGKRHPHPPDLAGDVAKLIEKGAKVFLVQDDAAERGLEPNEFVPGTTPIARAALPKLFADFDQVWRW